MHNVLFTGPLRQKVYMITHSNSNAEASFVEKFQTKMQEFGIEIHQRTTSDASSLEPDLFLIFVCNATSRIESDIENAFDERISM